MLAGRMPPTLCPYPGGPPGCSVENYVVTKRAPGGEPREIQCQAHTACKWTTQSQGAKRDDDAIFVAQFRNHIIEARTPDVPAFGHARRSRQKK